MAYNDPFSLVYQSLWDCINTNEYVTALVKKGNRIRLDQAPSPLKKSVNDGDLPELMVVPDGGNVRLQATSSGTKVTKRFLVILSTGDVLITERIMPVEFALIRALKNWTETVAKIEWFDKRFVTLVRMGSITEGTSNSEANRGISGWSAIMNIEVEMTFRTEDL